MENNYTISCLQYIQIKKFVKILWHKYDLMIPHRLVSATLVNNHMRFPMNTKQGEGTSPGK